jgi:hypothetical protein
VKLCCTMRGLQKYQAAGLKLKTRERPWDS